jgi:hypothetical protein
LPLAAEAKLKKRYITPKDKVIELAVSAQTGPNGQKIPRRDAQGNIFVHAVENGVTDTKHFIAIPPETILKEKKEPKGPVGRRKLEYCFWRGWARTNQTVIEKIANAFQGTDCYSTKTKNYLGLGFAGHLFILINRGGWLGFHESPGPKFNLFTVVPCKAGWVRYKIIMSKLPASQFDPLAQSITEFLKLMVKNFKEKEVEI